MSLVVADSSVWIDLFRGERNAATARLRDLKSANRKAPLLIVPDLILFEVLRGARTEAAWQKIDRTMRRFDVLAITGEDAALAAAARYRTLRGRGVTVRKSLDVLIASWCLDHDAALLHRDRDFVPFEQVFGLRVA